MNNFKYQKDINNAPKRFIMMMSQDGSGIIEFIPQKLFEDQNYSQA
jgi:hypothetical protein